MRDGLNHQGNEPEANLTIVHFDMALINPPFNAHAALRALNQALNCYLSPELVARTNTSSYNTKDNLALLCYRAGREVLEDKAVAGLRTENHLSKKANPVRSLLPCDHS
jgi:hypothetical protein